MPYVVTSPEQDIWIVVSYSDGALVAYDNREQAVEARDIYHQSGLYPYEETYICEVTLYQND